MADDEAALTSCRFCHRALVDFTAQRGERRSIQQRAVAELDVATSTHDLEQARRVLRAVYRIAPRRQHDVDGVAVGHGLEIPGELGGVVIGAAGEALRVRAVGDDRVLPGVDYRVVAVAPAGSAALAAHDGGGGGDGLDKRAIAPKAHVADGAADDVEVEFLARGNLEPPHHLRARRKVHPRGRPRAQRRGDTRVEVDKGCRGDACVGHVEGLALLLWCRPGAG